MVSLTYMPVSKRYLPWQVSSHELTWNFQKSIQNVLKNNLFSKTQAPKLKYSWDETKSSFEKIWHFQSL